MLLFSYDQELAAYIRRSIPSGRLTAAPHIFRRPRNLHLRRKFLPSRLSIIGLRKSAGAHRVGPAAVHGGLPCGHIPPTPQEYPISGLNLLRLLMQNRIAEFHTELELLSYAALENPFIKHAVELEQSFTERAYNRVLSARQMVPHETYVYFMDLLAKAVRDEIARCGKKAYDYLSISDASQMLLCSSYQEPAEYIKETDMKLTFAISTCHLAIAVTLLGSNLAREAQY